MTSQVKLPSDVKGLNLSIAMIIRAKHDEERISKTFYKDIEKKFEDQAKIEKEFLYHNRWVCPPSVEDVILERKTELTTVDISRKEDSKMFLDSKSLESLACVAQNIVLFDGPSLRTGYNFIRKLITDLRLIGSPSLSGVVMSTTIYNKYSDLIIIKAPKYNTKFTESAINHEIVVGKILNSLRSIIPNFAFVLGSFECGPPIIEPKMGSNNKIITWCRGGEKVKYIMYENISGSESLYDFVDKCSAQEYMDVMIQLFHALMIAHNKVGFTHYDLHGYNILVRPIKGHEEGVYIPYDGNFVFANNLVSIIDYGHSHVYLPGTKTSLGIKTDEGPEAVVQNFANGTYIDKPNPLTDCHRIVEATLGSMERTNKKVFNKVKGLLYYFYNEDEPLDNILNKKNGDKIPLFGDKDYSERVGRFKYENFIRYCREYCDLNDLNDPVVSGRDYEEVLDDSIIFSPGSMNIIKPSQKDIKFNINNIDELFDIIEPVLIYKTYLRDQTHMSKDKIDVYNKLLDKIYHNINEQKDSITNIMTDEIINLENMIKSSPLIHYKQIPKNDVHILRNEIALREYLRNFEIVVKYLDSMDFIERRIEMLKFVDTHILDQLSRKLKELEQEYHKVDEREIFYNFLMKDANTINNYLNSKYNLDTVDERIGSVVDNMISVIPI